MKRIFSFEVFIWVLGLICAVWLAYLLTVHPPDKNKPTMSQCVNGVRYISFGYNEHNANFTPQYNSDGSITKC